MSALTVDGVDVDLDGRAVVREVSCAVDSGGWLAVIGPNGAGKSTLLRAVAGLLPRRGRVAVDGADTRGMPGRELARLLAFVPQSPILPPDMTVAEYVLLGRTPYLGYLGGPGRHDRLVADEAAEQLDVARFAERRLVTLSGGERQRVVLARALAQEPRLVLLDEPTSALDIGHQQQVLDLVDDLRRAQGLTVVTTLHDLTTAGQYADRLVLLDEGRVKASGPAPEVLSEALISDVYAARVRVTVDGHGRPVVTPLRDRAAAEGGPR
ncbi:ABC transporter ATP-binding protein [Streptacidiphilus melanogenes]|uniref:ABC transporter ATP-binding protein n=1 Tax=Streptacidiphilus melanogenes TaxID=411235 RepID=UPI0005A90576|nr:ABC transporter ATP-binding protein [Streptacidiphilus melanogenes]